MPRSILTCNQHVCHDFSRDEVCIVVVVVVYSNMLCELSVSLSLLSLSNTVLIAAVVVRIILCIPFFVFFWLGPFLPKSNQFLCRITLSLTPNFSRIIILGGKSFDTLLITQSQHRNNIFKCESIPSIIDQDSNLYI